jgi:AraC-like DNA-binding protein
MKASIIWEPTASCPPIDQILLSNTPHIQVLPLQAGVSPGLMQLRKEQPELIFLVIDPKRPDYLALIRLIKQTAPASFLIVLAKEEDTPRCAGADLRIPPYFSGKQLLDAVFQAELALSGVEPEEPSPAARELPDPKEFLDALQEKLYQFPEQLCDQHWLLLEAKMEADANAVGWHLVGLSNLMVERSKTAESAPPALVQAQAECLRLLAEGPSVPLWKGVYSKLCDVYLEVLLTGGDPTGGQVARIRQYIDNHIEEDVSLKRVAQEFFLNTSYLSRLFKSKAGVTFSDYISMRKIERAKSLLTETDLTVAQISLRLNYPEQNSFSRFFKGKVGMSPQTYRSQNTERNKEKHTPPKPALEEFEITDFGPCAFTSDDYSFAYSFAKRQ